MNGGKVWQRNEQNQHTTMHMNETKHLEGGMRDKGKTVENTEERIWKHERIDGSLVIKLPIINRMNI